MTLLVIMPIDTMTDNVFLILTSDNIDVFLVVTLIKKKIIRNRELILFFIL